VVQQTAQGDVMSGGFPVGYEVANGVNFGTLDSGTTDSVPVTGGAANTKGSYVVVGTTTADTSFALVKVSGFANVSTRGLMDIAVGATGSETIVANNLCIGSPSNNNQAQWGIPLVIPKSTQINARCQTSTATDNMHVVVYTFDGAFTQMEGAGGLDSIGADLSNSRGTLVDAGAVANTKGAYAVLTASSARDYMGFFFTVDQGSQTGWNFQNFLIDVAIGATGSEKIIFPEFYVKAVGSLVSNGFFSVTSHFIAVAVPAGTQIQARAQCDTATASQRVIGVTLYGLYR
jgi:hypothetical protein